MRLSTANSSRRHKALLDRRADSAAWCSPDEDHADAKSCRSSGPYLTAEPAPERRKRAGFTLIELILVMSILVVVLAVAAPSLSRFFRGRTLDSEATRFLALTRYCQSRAVSEGMPVLLWIDAKQGAYGLQADSSYVEEDDRSVEFQLDKEVQVEVEQSPLALQRSAVWKGGPGSASALPKIRFTPDGFLAESSPESIVFRQGEDGEIWIGLNRNRLNYELKTNQVQTARR